MGEHVTHSTEKQQKTHHFSFCFSLADISLAYPHTGCPWAEK
jgi:hypothetical protein